MRCWGINGGPPSIETRKKKKIIGAQVNVLQGKNYHKAILIIPNNSNPTNADINAHLANNAMVDIYWIEYSEYDETVPSGSVKPLFEEEEEDEEEAAANTTAASLPVPSSSRRGNGNNNSTRRRSTSRGNNSRRDTSNTTSHNNTTQATSRSSINNTTHPGREGGRTGARTDTALQVSSSQRGNSARRRSTSRGNNSRRDTTSQTNRNNNNPTQFSRNNAATNEVSATIGLERSSSPRGNNSNNNNRGRAARSSSSLSTAVSTSQTNGNDIAKQSKKKSKIETKTIPIPPTKSISVASTSSRGRRPVFNNCRVDMNLFQRGVEVNFTDIADNTTKCGRLIYWDKDDRTWMIRKDSDGSIVNVDPNDIVGFKEFIPTIVKRQVDERCYEVMAIGYEGNYYIAPDCGEYWSVLLQSDAFKRFNNDNISGNKRDLSRPSSGASQSSTAGAGHGGGDFPIFLSPVVSSREKGNSTSTGLTPSTATLGLTPLFKTAVGGDGLFGDGMVVEGGSGGGDSPTTQHPSLSLQGFNNQTPLHANNYLGDNGIDLGYDIVHQLKSNFAGGTSAAHNDMVLQSPSSQPPDVQNLPGHPPEEEQPAAPLSSNNKEETINTYVAEASSSFETLSGNVFTNPVFQYMLKQSVASKVASLADLRQHYLTKVQRWQNPTHYISIAHGCRQIKLRYQGIKGAYFIGGIESLEKAKLARIVILLTLIPSWDKENMTLAEKEYEIKLASIAALLATGKIGNVKELDSTSNITYNNRDGWMVNIYYNGSTVIKQKGNRITVSCKTKEHALLVRNELSELLTDTDTAYAHLSGDQKGNICDPSVPIGLETDAKVEDVKCLAKERLIKTGKFNNYRPGFLAVYWSNAQDNALKEYVLNGMIGGNVCNKRQQNTLNSRIYSGVDWEATSLISELKGRTAYACEIRWYKQIANVPRHVPVLLRPFYCAALTGEGRIRVFQQKDAILNAILRDGIDDDDEQEVVVEEKEEEEMEVLAPLQVKSGEDFGGAESSKHYDDTTVPIDFNQQPDPVKSGEDDVSTKFEHDMRKEEAVEHDDDDDEDLDKELRQMMGLDKDDADIQNAFKQRMIEFGGNGETLAPFTAPIHKNLRSKSQATAKKPSESASEFYSMQLYKRIQNSKSTSDVVKQCKKLSYDKIRMLFEADMQQFFNNNDKRKSNLYMAVLGKTTKANNWQNIASIVGTTEAYCKKYWEDSIRAISKNNKLSTQKTVRSKLAKEADKVSVLMRGALTKLLEEHGLIEKSAERESLIGTDVVIEQKLPSLPQEGGM